MRLIIVDDEPLARFALLKLCEAQRDVEVIAEADSGGAALETLRTEHPDVMLLDIELRDMSGFDVLGALRAEDTPATIMITAHTEHALRAFNSAVIDYVTKPVNLQRFEHSLARARHWQAASLDVRAPAPAPVAPPRRLVAEKCQRLYFLDTETIEYLEADGNYVIIHVADQQYIVRNTLKRLAEILAPLGFVRIERALLVNLNHVAFGERLGHGTFALILNSGRRLVSSASYRRGILQAMR